jgi:hypothetical protein
MCCFACRKPNVYDTSPSVQLAFSSKQVSFDTVFTATGSATKNFIVRNTSSKAIKISEIKLAGGDASQFRMNVNGVAGTDFHDFEIDVGDSIFIFVEVTVNPNSETSPFIAKDSITFQLNGNQQYVNLMAYGQNAHYFKSVVLYHDTTWKSDLPFVIVNSMGIARGVTLTIDEGVKIYSHDRSAIISDGTIKIMGTKDKPVILSGDRLEQKYKNTAGQWYGIQFLNKSEGNIIQHAIIQNAIIGIEADSMPVTPGKSKLSIQKTVIKNMTSAGLAAFGSYITGQDLLVYSCGQSVIYCDLGGQYMFANCTFDNSYPPSAQPNATIVLGNTDYTNSSTGQVLVGNLSASFRDCIIWGNIDDEVQFIRKGTGTFADTFQYNVVKSKTLHFDGTNQVNKDPRFTNTANGQYKPVSGSSAEGNGILTPISIPSDIDDNNWVITADNKMPVGAYQF